MNEIDLRLMKAATAIADDLSFSKAAIKLNITQPALTKQIHDLEDVLGTPVFNRDHQRVELTDAGRAFVEEAKLSLAHHDRAIHAARAIAKGADALLSLGVSPYIDPWLTDVVSSVQLPLFPDLQLHFESDYSTELVRKVDSGELDLAVVTDGLSHKRLAAFHLMESPFHLLVEDNSALAGLSKITLSHLDGLPWILFSRHVHPPLYERIQKRAEQEGIAPTERHHVTNAEHAAQWVRRTHGVAFLTRHGASRVAKDGLVHCPLIDPQLNVRSVIVARNDAGRVVSEFVRTTVRRVKKLSEPLQPRLPLTGS